MKNRAKRANVMFPGVAVKQAALDTNERLDVLGATQRQTAELQRQIVDNLYALWEEQQKTNALLERLVAVAERDCPTGSSRATGTSTSRATCSPHDGQAVEHGLHVGEGLTLFQPARLAGVVGVSGELPPPDELSPEASPGKAVASGHGARLDV